ncbi:hypothetical protein BO83DRAFT_93399 [Aspergillus eucalypticola CBS 122712]|uniref:Uncharacterized protein n=1 Tax=Aspergillus eucalypticola (strain CBS 122712 / IBT 29274) TaxID=1448314 RepID=A0A317V0X4_ASPEC|nr:uncharacterized protein BO83DRAFT_93399 [Aspergillus eucalypticola CBS 122712]PWY67695.1 hypothetical protein BO83DRAFT_93399 [Aspergillus eucalypticola CBS 122712]
MHSFHTEVFNKWIRSSRKNRVATVIVSLTRTVLAEINPPQRNFDGTVVQCIRSPHTQPKPPDPGRKQGIGIFRIIYSGAEKSWSQTKTYLPWFGRSCNEQELIAVKIENKWLDESQFKGIVYPSRGLSGGHASPFSIAHLPHLANSSDSYLSPYLLHSLLGYPGICASWPFRIPLYPIPGVHLRSGKEKQ